MLKKQQPKINQMKKEVIEGIIAVIVAFILCAILENY